MKRELRQLREALLDITGVLNRPQPDAALIALAGIDSIGRCFRFSRASSVEGL